MIKSLIESLTRAIKGNYRQHKGKDRNMESLFLIKIKDMELKNIGRQYLIMDCQRSFIKSGCLKRPKRGEVKRFDLSRLYIHGVKLRN